MMSDHRNLEDRFDITLAQFSPGHFPEFSPVIATDADPPCGPPEDCASHIGTLLGAPTKRFRRNLGTLINLGGKALDQNLEQLRIMVTVRERDSSALRSYVARFR
jgi:hypothetical protein